MDVATLAMTALAAPWAHHGWDGDGAGWMWLGGTLMIAVWIGLAALVTWAIARRPDARPTPPPPGERAREILAERYARGEIDGDEYRERLEALR